MAAVMLCTLSVPAFAATITESGNQSSNTTVMYGVESSYVITVPDSVSIDTDNLTGNVNIAASNVVVPAGYTLNVTLTSDFTLTDAANASNTLGYEAKLNDAVVVSGSAILTVASGDTDGESVALTLSLTETPTTAGAYSDVITFGVSVANIITFTIWDELDNIQYQAEDGMTWAQWCNSRYNTGEWSLSPTNVVMRGVQGISNPMGQNAYGTDVIVNGWEYYASHGGGSN